MKNKILLSLIAILLACSMVSCYYTVQLPTKPTSSSPTTGTTQPSDIESPEAPEKLPVDYLETFYLIDVLFKNFSIFDVDEEAAMLAAIRAYVGATGDKYAMYYTPEELAAMEAENNGDLYGIGVQVVFDYDGYFMEIVLIMPDSPAEECLEIGDKVTHVKVDNEWVALTDLVAEYKLKAKEIYPTYTDEEINNVACYEAFQYAIAQIKGVEGSYTEVKVDRNGVVQEMKIQRAKVKTVSVTSKVSIRDPKVGIVYISQFDLTTPVQFKDAMDSLISRGCNKFVFDVRNNPGGDLASVVAVLSTLLQKNDVILSTKDHNGTVVVTKCQEVVYNPDSNYSTCNVSLNDIGKYRGYDMVVLANENSASAAELFTSCLRDHELADIVGVKTYGKGSVQSIISLNYYGESYYGALKLTTKLYFPPCGEGYDGGIGITPDYPVELEGIAAETNFYKLTEEIDNQLQQAVSVLIDN